MAFTFDNNTISDLYKDVTGSRPSADYMEVWNELNDTEKQEEWDRLVTLLGEVLDQERRIQQDALNQFLMLLNLAESHGAKTELEQIKWIISSELSINDLRYGSSAVCYHFGLSYQNELVDVIQQACRKLVEEHERREIV